MKRFKVVWTETHSAVVEAKDEVEAKEKMMDNDYVGRESSEIDSFDAFELEK